MLKSLFLALGLLVATTTASATERPLDVTPPSLAATVEAATSVEDARVRLDRGIALMHHGRWAQVAGASAMGSGLVVGAVGMMLLVSGDRLLPVATVVMGVGVVGLLGGGAAVLGGEEAYLVGAYRARRAVVELGRLHGLRGPTVGFAMQGAGLALALVGLAQSSSNPDMAAVEAAFGGVFFVVGTAVGEGAALRTTVARAHLQPSVTRSSTGVLVPVLKLALRW